MVFYFYKALEAFGKVMLDSGYEITGFQYAARQFDKNNADKSTQTVVYSIENEEFFEHVQSIWRQVYTDTGLVNINVIKSKITSEEQRGII